MTLIEESDEYVIIVSPYVKISKWYKLLKKFNNLNQRNIPVNFIIRDDKTNQTSFDQLNELGINFTAIKDLHCKLYMNEKYAIVSSMNLLLSSEINSLELAYQTETETEQNELKEFCERHLSIDFSNSTDVSYDVDLKDYICKSISKKIGRNVAAHQENGTLNINIGINNYSAFIWNSKQNKLRISGVLSSKEYDFINKNKQNMPKVTGLNIELQKGGNRFNDMVWGTSEIPLKSYDLYNVIDNEKSIIAKKILTFILEIDGFKERATHNNVYNS